MCWSCSSSFFFCSSTSLNFLFFPWTQTHIRENKEKNTRTHIPRKNTKALRKTLFFKSQSDSQAVVGARGWSFGARRSHVLLVAWAHPLACFIFTWLIWEVVYGWGRTSCSSSFFFYPSTSFSILLSSNEHELTHTRETQSHKKTTHASVYQERTQRLCLKHSSW
jgi:hypothetical protein